MQPTKMRTIKLTIIEDNKTEETEIHRTINEVLKVLNVYSPYPIKQKSELNYILIEHNDLVLFISVESIDQITISKGVPIIRTETSSVTLFTHNIYTYIH